MKTKYCCILSKVKKPDACWSLAPRDARTCDACRRRSVDACAVANHINYTRGKVAWRVFDE
jgi:hypothetical protein